MATVSGATNEKVYSIPKWLGLNEHPDGDTRLKLGEAAVMENWKITRDGNLKRRPGMEFFAGLSEQYTYEISDDVASILEGALPTDEIPVYGGVTAEAPQGTITLIGAAGVVEKGVYSVEGAAVGATEEEKGVLSGTDIQFSVDKGILSPGGFSDMVTFADLYGILAELPDGQYLYTRYNEMPYALRNDSLVLNNGRYDLSGYPVRAVADSETVEPVAGLWSGMVGGKQVLLAACDGGLWNLYNEDNDTVDRTFIGAINTDKGVRFIPFDNKVYILNGYEYMCYDGFVFEPVAGYIPLVAITIGPQGTGEAGELTSEYVNLLNNKRRVWLSPDGENATFALPEEAHTIDVVTDLSGDGVTYTATFAGDAKEFTLSPVPPKAVNSIEVQYSVTTSYRSQVTGMLYGELYSGTTDTRIFLYGDGSNKTIYSGMDYDGMPRADYFPDQYEVRVGDSNTPITAMIRHYGSLIVYKPTECWAIQHGVVELATGDLTPSIYCTPVNREKGCAAPGQVALVNNSPVTCSGSELYQWTNSSYYTSSLTRDERQARRISDRIQTSIKQIDFQHCCMWDDNDGQEFYLSSNGITLVWNYVVDCWYRYNGLDAVIMCNFKGDVIFGTSDGRIFRLTYDRDTDDGTRIDAYWESGAMDFGASNMRKYSSMMWIGLKPEAGASVKVTVVTDRKNTFREKIVSADKAKVAGQPFPVRSKIKAKKFTYYKLILYVDEKIPAVTITNVDFRVRQTGYSK